MYVVVQFIVQHLMLFQVEDIKIGNKLQNIPFCEIVEVFESERDNVSHVNVFNLSSGSYNIEQLMSVMNANLVNVQMEKVETSGREDNHFKTKYKFVIDTSISGETRKIRLPAQLSFLFGLNPFGQTIERYIN